MFFVIDMEERVRTDHPLRTIKAAVDEILTELGPLFDRAYSRTGRPGVPPEVLLKALLLQCLYTIRSERQLVERIDTDLLFRWFCGLDPAEEVFDATAFTHNRPRLDEYGITAAFFDAVTRRAIDAGLASDEHFSVDGTLIESYASIKSLTPIDDDNDSNSSNNNNSNSNSNNNDGDDIDANDQANTDEPGEANGFKPRNAEVNFRNTRRSNATHRSTTDPEARLYRKARGQEARLSHLAHAISENRNGLVMAVSVSEANGRAECTAAVEMVDALRQRSIEVGTLGADRGYDSGPLMIALEERGVTPHVAMRSGRVGGASGAGRRPKRDRPLIAARERMRDRMNSTAYTASRRSRKKVEEVFGWMKTIAGLGRSRHVGRWKLKQQVELAAACYNLVRMRSLLSC